MKDSRVCQPKTIFLLFAALLLIGRTAVARDYGYHEGYTNNIEAERTEVITDMQLISPPPTSGAPLQDRIFDATLTKDFRERYEQKFGRTEAERVYNSPNRFTYYNDLYTFKGSPQEEAGEKKAFANYMVRKLLEYHVQNYAKNDPKVRPMWEAKEKFSGMNVRSKSFKLDARYDLVGGKCDIEIENPWVNTKYTLDLHGTQVDESYLVLSKQVPWGVTVQTQYKQVEGILAFIASRTMAPNLGANITVSTFTNDSTKSTRESLYLAGASYVF